MFEPLVDLVGTEKDAPHGLDDDHTATAVLLHERIGVGIGTQGIGDLLDVGGFTKSNEHGRLASSARRTDT